MSSEEHSKTSDLVTANIFGNTASNMRFVDVQKFFEREDKDADMQPAEPARC